MVASEPIGLATPRLLVRPYRPSPLGSDGQPIAAGDERALHEAIEASRQSLLPWLPWAKSGHLTPQASRDDIVRFTREAGQLEAGKAMVLGVFLRDAADSDPTRGSTLVGGVGFHTIRVDTHQAEIGYWTDARHRRRGYCSEATRWLLSWMLTPQHEQCVDAAGDARPGWGFRRVEITCAEPNLASRGVPIALGLRQEQRLAQAKWIDGIGWCDSLGWGVLRDEWDRHNHAMRA
jgi:RimJ/RimL family protein N-acetyltransferase